MGKNKKKGKKRKTRKVTTEWLEPVNNTTLQTIVRFIKTIIFHFFWQYEEVRIGRKI